MKELACLLLSVLVLVGCINEEYERDFPAVTTSPQVVVEEDGVLVKGYVDGGWSSKIMDIGFIYYLAETDGLYADKVSLGSGNDNISTFEIKIVRNLIIDEEYIFKAYVKTDKFTVYGDEQRFISKGGKAPFLKNFSPQKAWIGDTLTIQGMYFLRHKC